MKKVKSTFGSFINKLSLKSSVLMSALLLTVVAVSEMSTQSCILMIIGQDDIPEELI